MWASRRTSSRFRSGLGLETEVKVGIKTKQTISMLIIPSSQGCILREVFFI